MGAVGWLPAGMRPMRAYSRAWGSSGRASACNDTQTPEACAISSRCPPRPKPVMSVAAGMRKWAMASPGIRLRRPHQR